jgi:hypothetical protein
VNGAPRRNVHATCVRVISPTSPAEPGCLAPRGARPSAGCWNPVRRTQTCPHTAVDA